MQGLGASGLAHLLLLLLVIESQNLVRPVESDPLSRCQPSSIAIPLLQAHGSTSLFAEPCHHVVRLDPAHMRTLAWPAAKVWTWRARDKVVALPHEVVGVVLGHRTRWYVQDGGIGRACVGLVHCVDGVAVPGNVVAGCDARDVDHGLVHVEMGVQQMRQFLPVSWRSALDPGGRRGVELPVVGCEVRCRMGRCRRGCVRAGWCDGTSLRREEGAEEVVRRCLFKERIHKEGALEWARGRHGQPALEHAECAAGPDALVQIGVDGQAAARLPGIKVFPFAFPDGVVDLAESVALLGPPLDAPAIDMGAKCEFGVAGAADAQPVGVADGVLGGERGVGVRAVPVGHEEAVRFEEVGVAACEELDARPV